MGANATTSVPTYVAGEVLTAADLNVTNSGIPVFANSTDRTNSFGGTGEKTLAEGQFAYLEDDNKTYYYDGAAWQQVGASGFVVVKAETAFSAASSVTADNVFTSTYRNYRLIVNYTTSSTAGVRFRVRAGASSVSTSTYNEQELTGIDASAAASRGASSTSIAVAKPSNGSFNSSFEVLISNPQVATPTVLISTNFFGNGAYTAPGVMICGGNNSNATSYDGFELFTSSGTMTGNYTVYGMATA